MTNTDPRLRQAALDTRETGLPLLAALLADVAEAQPAPPPAVYGACGVEGCTDCRPLFDADNQPIPGTDTDGALPVPPWGNN